MQRVSCVSENFASSTQNIQKSSVKTSKQVLKIYIHVYMDMEMVLVSSMSYFLKLTPNKNFRGDQLIP